MAVPGNSKTAITNSDKPAQRVRQQAARPHGACRLSHSALMSTLVSTQEARQRGHPCQVKTLELEPHLIFTAAEDAVQCFGVGVDRRELTVDQQVEPQLAGEPDRYWIGDVDTDAVGADIDAFGGERRLAIDGQPDFGTQYFAWGLPLLL